MPKAFSDPPNAAVDQRQRLSLQPILEPIRADLETVEARMMAAAGETYEPLASALQSLLASGGKRLRPALVVLSARLHQWDPAPVVSLAAAVEMLHTATLIHDDTIDGAPMRRGQRTLNATWRPAATILAGDYLFARAAALAAETGNTRVASIFANTLMTICQGELQQMLALSDWRGTHSDYYARIYAKTASLFAASCEAGAVLGKAPDDRVEQLREYGRLLGLAFQIVDDILDFTGDEGSLGKPVGSDLRQGIATLPIHHYLRTGGDPLLVEAALQRNGAGDAVREQAVDKLLSLVLTSPAIAACRREAHDLARQARATISTLSASPYHETLCRLADFVAARSV
ncbi:MAG: polyprenyl synthetase family protein [Anaerolineae bacterium]